MPNANQQQPQNQGIGAALSGLTTALHKMFMGLSTTFKTLFQSILSSLGPLLLLVLAIEPLTALLEGILEPFELLIPVFEEWGMIIGSLLYPIMDSIIPILVSLTPLLIGIVEVALPILEILPAIVAVLIPVIEFLVKLIVVFTTISSVAATAAKEIITVLLGIQEALFSVFFGFKSAILDNLISFFRTLKEGVTAGFTNIVDAILVFFRIKKAETENEYSASSASSASHRTGMEESY